MGCKLIDLHSSQTLKLSWPELSRDCPFPPLTSKSIRSHWGRLVKEAGLCSSVLWPVSVLLQLLPKSFIAGKITCACFSVHSHVKGLHLNIAFMTKNIYTLTPLLGQRFGRFLGYTERDIELLYPFKEKVFNSIVRESGYLHIQAPWISLS